jgi:hypothetical protein
MSRIGREKHLEKQEKMETILAHAQELVSSLSSLMPTPALVRGLYLAYIAG